MIEESENLFRNYCVTLAKIVLLVSVPLSNSCFQILNRALITFVINLIRNTSFGFCLVDEIAQFEEY